MTIINQPDVTLNIIPAQQTISNSDQRVLFVGQKTSSGTATASALTTNIGINGEEDGLFGATSILAQMVRSARLINKETRFDAIALSDNAGGTQATGTVAFSGTATEDGTLTLTIGSDTNYALTLDITSGDTATVIGELVDTAVAALTNAPFTSNNVTGTVTITCVHKGTVGNSIGLRVQGSVAGVTVALTAFASGATDPSLTSIFDVIEGERYQTVVWQHNLTLSTLTTELDARFNVNNDILDGVGIITLADTYANLVSAGDAENSASLVIFGNKKLSDSVHKGGALLEFNDVISAQFAGIRSLRLTDGANISQYVISRNGVLDSFGGTALASKPYFNTLMPYLSLIPAGKGFSTAEVEGLFDAGVATLGNNRAQNSCILGEIVTTRKTDAQGFEELTFQFLNSVDTNSNAREYLVNNLKSRYAQSRLTDGDLVPGRDMANSTSIKAYIVGLYNDLSGGDYVLTQAGSTALTYFKENLTVTTALQSGTATVTMKLPIVTQLRVITGTIQVAFDTTA